MRMQSAPRRIMKQANGNLRGRQPIAALAGRYGVSARTLERAFKRMDEMRGAMIE